MTTIRFPANSGRAATLAAAHILAPLLMPTINPSSLASRRAHSKASSSSTSTTSSTRDVSRFFGTNPAISQSSFVHLEGGTKSIDEFIARGGDITFVDVRVTESGKRWGNSLVIRPGTDIYLLLYLLQVCLQNLLVGYLTVYCMYSQCQVLANQVSPNCKIL